MADELDVQTRLSTDITAVLTPLFGTTYTPERPADQAELGTNLPVPDITVAPGHDLLADLMQRLKNDRGTCYVYADTAMTNVPQAQQDARAFPIQALSPKLTITIDDDANSCTLGGALQAGDVVGATQGSNGGTYLVTGNEANIAAVAAGWAANCVTAGIAATVSGSTVTIAGSLAVFNVGTTEQVGYVVWRRRKVFFAELIVTNPYERQILGKALQTLYDPQTPNSTLLALADGTQAQVLQMDTIPFESSQRDGGYLLRVRWLIEFAAVKIVPGTSVVATTVDQTISPPGTSVSPPPTRRGSML